MSKRRYATLGTAAALAAVLLLGATSASAAGRAGNFPSAEVNVNDIASLQRGAKLFVNYCQGCHSLQYMRYQRLADDLELSEDMVMSNLVFADKKIGDTMTIAMGKDAGTQWFGKAPPDLSVTGRSRGADWIHAYLLSYYRDETGAWNNTVLENPAMPHPLWRLQGIQEAVYETHSNGGVEMKTVTGLELVEPGTMSPEEYADAMRDLTAFLTYVSEPAQLKRKDIGIWVMLFLAFFALVAYLLKREYWRDVH
jgi:ubiquinol-cytochrome c reductase cytochrome c1 subunit